MVSIERLKQYSDILQEIPATCLHHTGKQVSHTRAQKEMPQWRHIPITSPATQGQHESLTSLSLNHDSSEILGDLRHVMYYFELCEISQSNAVPVDSALLPIALG
jgi:hypothetical protein